MRDALLGATRDDGAEIDFTTNATPDASRGLMAPLCSALWEQGRAFGTIGGTLRANGLEAEVTTFRSEAYVDHSRKPRVQWGDSLEADLSRRDFTINALALDVVALAEGRDERPDALRLLRGLARPPRRGCCARRSTPRSSLRDDPLRMLRAARFAARFDLIDRSRGRGRGDSECASSSPRSRPSACAANSTCCW